MNDKQRNKFPVSMLREGAVIEIKAITYFFPKDPQYEEELKQLRLEQYLRMTDK